MKSVSPAYGGLGRRFLAWMVDLAVEVAAMVPIGMLAAAATSFAGEDVANGSAIAAGLLLDAIYFTVFESSALQGTPGKRLLGMVVVDLDGNRLTFVRASARYAAKTLSVLIVFAGLIQIGLHSRKQGLHDVLARTLVIRRPLRASHSAAQPA